MPGLSVLTSMAGGGDLKLVDLRIELAVTSGLRPIKRAAWLP